MLELQELGHQIDFGNFSLLRVHSCHPFARNIGANLGELSQAQLLTSSRTKEMRHKTENMNVGVLQGQKMNKMSSRDENALSSFGNRPPIIRQRKSMISALNSVRLIPQNSEHSKSLPNPKYNFLVISLMKLKNA
jgi:hypothetical protein